VGERGGWERAPARLKENKHKRSSGQQNHKGSKISLLTFNEKGGGNGISSNTKSWELGLTRTNGKPVCPKLSQSPGLWEKVGPARTKIKNKKTPATGTAAN